MSLWLNIYQHCIQISIMREEASWTRKGKFHNHERRLKSYNFLIEN